jgi:histidine decarboxylase
MASVVVNTTNSGEMDYADLRAKLLTQGQGPAIVVANIGTTMTEAIDDVAQIRGVLDTVGVMQRHIHSDAALVGPYAACMTPRPAFDFADGADSIVLSGHKFLGAPMPCGVVLTRNTERDGASEHVSYIDTADTTLTGSRSGHSALVMWYALNRWGTQGLRRRYQNSLKLAQYTENALRSTGNEVWRNPRAITVMLRTPQSRELCYKWQLATHDGWSHIICMPGLTTSTIDRFVSDVLQHDAHCAEARQSMPRIAWA